MTTRVRTLYNTDFNLWIETQAQILRECLSQPEGQRQLGELDLENLIEEIESLGKSDKRQLKSRLEVLLHHLLKWCYQPENRTNSWRATINEQRNRLRDLLLDSPSLKTYLEAIFSDCHGDARYQAALETGLPIDTFPVDCPFAIADVVNRDFWPEKR